jgi:ABC-type transport system involved in cytochrome bd biosynthesis fused ATPase/permease subunit
MEWRMFYRKNVWAWEQLVRLVAGAMMIGGGLMFLSGWLAYGIAIMGLYLALTGLFGYCPACAMIGRKHIDKS